MIFLFSDLETLRIALTSGMIPAAVSGSSAEVAFDSEGRPSVKVDAAPPKPMRNSLKRLGVKEGKEHGGVARAVASWPEILPIVKQTGAREATSTTTILFEMPAAQLSIFAIEMLRLGNDRQSFRAFSAESGPRVLLRVIGPPYYTLLRAVDCLDADVVAYVEMAERVWVEIGCVHPLAAQLKIAEGQLLLLRPPNRWTTIEDGPFQDIYEIVDFQLPAAAIDLEESALPGKMIVPLRLAPGDAAAAPEMWILRENASGVFDEFVCGADHAQIARLMFAVAENGQSGPAIVLRKRASKLAAPIVALPGSLGFVPDRRVKNLFLPAGTRLRPTLRRDAVREMLAADPDRIVWLMPLADGQFVPKSLPDDAFRPLQDWVDYVIDRERESLQSWIQATRFDFDLFVCKDERLEQNPKPRSAGKSKARKPGDKATDDLGVEPTAAAESAKGKGKSAENVGDDDAVVPPTSPPDELKKKRAEMEDAFLAVEGPLEAPERIALWPKLAKINAALGDHSEAAICWLNGLWERGDLPSDWLAAWRESENKSGDCKPPAAQFDRLLAIGSPSQAEMRRLLTAILSACTRSPAPAALTSRLPEIRRHLEKLEPGLSVRAVWLVWLHLAKISGDVLGLARVRDRLLERLFKNGLKPQYDTPNFIRFAGRRDSGRLRRVQDYLLQFRDEVHSWLDRQNKTKDGRHQSLETTVWYADLIFAFGLAKVGEERHRIELMEAARANLAVSKGKCGKSEKVHRFLTEAFGHRIEQVVRGELPEGPLPAPILRRLEEMDYDEGYAVNRLRKQLRALDPHEISDLYRAWKPFDSSPLHSQLAALRAIADPKKLASRIRGVLLKDGKPLDRDTLQKVLIEVLPLSMRAGESVAQDLLGQVTPFLSQPTKSSKSDRSDSVALELQAKLVNSAVTVAANFGRVELVQKFLGRFIENIRGLNDECANVAIEHGLGQWIRSVRKYGLKDQIESLLKDLTDILLKGRSLEQIRLEYAKPSLQKEWIHTLRSLLQLAEYWAFFGWQSKAKPIVDEVRAYLFGFKERKPSNRSDVVLYLRMVCGHLHAASHLGDLDDLAKRIGEGLLQMEPLSNATTVKVHYSPFHLEIVESIVLSLVNDDFILGETARLWLDDDEYLVRRRIHGDMRRFLAHSVNG